MCPVHVYPDHWHGALRSHSPPSSAQQDTEGDCELCGRWDGHLNGGVCDECRRRLSIQDHGEHPVPATAAPRRTTLLPEHAHLHDLAKDVLEALIELDAAGALINRVELTMCLATLRLARPPIPGTLSGICENVVVERGRRIAEYRALFAPRGGRPTILVIWR